MERENPRFNIKSFRKYFVFVVSFLGVFSIGYVLGFKGLTASPTSYPKVTISRDNPVGKEELNFSLFWRVWDTLDSKYFDKTKLVPSKMVYGAIQGMVASLGDPYTVFLPPAENKVVQEDLSGSFEGVGIQIGFKGTQLAVIAPLPGSPAEKAGVKAGDLIIGIKDEIKDVDISTSGITLPEAVRIIRGPAGTKVTLILLRDGSEDAIEADITREPIEVSSIALEFVGESGEFAHIRVLKFVAETKDEWDEAVIEILKKPEVKGIIVDMRNNPGGYLQGAVDLASDFLDMNTVVVSEEHSSGRRTDFKVQNLGRLRNRTVVVLVNKGSASASEIFAGALRDDKKVPLVGEVTFGKGTIQEPEQVENGAGLHITVARWLTPNGIWVNDKGLVPDHELEDNPETEVDEQLQKAIEVLKSITI